MQTIELRQTVRQTLNQQQRQSLNVLQMPLPALEDYLDAVLLENPLLERMEPGGGAQSGVMPPAAPADILFSAFAQETLAQHLYEQLLGLRLDAARASRMETLIAALDDRGYLPLADEECAQLLQAPLGTARKDRRLLQSLDPAGVGARDLSECLCLQLERQGDTHSLAYRIAKEHLHLVAQKQVAGLSVTFGVEKEAVQEALCELQSLNPKPANGFAPGSGVHYIEPDIWIIRGETEVKVRLATPERLCIGLNEDYIQMLQAEADTDTELRIYLKKHLQRAQELMHALSARANTLSLCARFIADRQEEFFKGGRLKSLQMTEISSALHMSASTISRALHGKYLLCERGVFPLRFFCVREVCAGSCAETIRMQIAEIIEGEDKTAPLSDREISGMLSERGFAIARRTVAKYRQEMLLPPAAQRKRR